MTMKRVRPGSRIKVRLPYSEVCMHMRVAGKIMNIEILKHSVQLYKDNRMISIPICLGEAGILVDKKGMFVNSWCRVHWLGKEKGYEKTGSA
jgi:hypothetical protein